jgi:exosortase A
MAAAVSAVLLGFWQTFVHMANVWSNSEDFSHGWLIAPIAVWLIWRNRNAWGQVKWSCSPLALVAFVLFFALWLAGEIGGVSAIRGLGVIGMILCALWSVSGNDFLRANFFPLAFLFAMIPAGEGLIPILTEYTADATVFAIRASGIAVYREGMHFVLPTGRWSVVDACSGLRYVIASAVLACLFCYLNFRTWRKRIIFFVTCMVLSVVANWIRAYSVVLVGHFSNMRYGTGEDHVWFGWVFYGLLMGIIFWVGSKYADPSVPLNTVPVNVAKAPRAWPMRVVFIAVLIVAILVGRSLPGRMLDFKPDALPFAKFDEKSGLVDGAFPFQPAFSKPLASISKRLGEDVWVWSGYFARQDQSQDMLGHGQRLIAESNTQATILKSEKLANNFHLAGGSLDSVTEFEVRTQEQRYLVWQLFRVGQYYTGSPYIAKGLRVLNVLLGRGDHSWAQAIATPLRGSVLESRERIKKFALRQAEQ